MHRYSFGPLAYVALGDKTSSKPTEAILANFSNNCLNQIYIYRCVEIFSDRVDANLNWTFSCFSPNYLSYQSRKKVRRANIHIVCAYLFYYHYTHINSKHIIQSAII